jgi:hypothetical protein
MNGQPACNNNYLCIIYIDNKFRNMVWIKKHMGLKETCLI